MIDLIICEEKETKYETKNSGLISKIIHIFPLLPNNNLIFGNGDNFVKVQVEYTINHNNKQVLLKKEIYNCGVKGLENKDETMLFNYENNFELMDYIYKNFFIPLEIETKSELSLLL
ncbi:MAG: hypothetical protein QXG86_00435 [Candidatus Woesearchaeota archaeon]